MARSPRAPEPPLALRMAPSVLRERLVSRSVKGRALNAVPANTDQELAAFEAEFQKWNDYNLTLLSTSFTNDSERSSYAWAVESTAEVGRESQAQRYRRHVSYIEHYCTALESLAERLDLIPLAPGVSAGPTGPLSNDSDDWWTWIHAEVRVVSRQRFEDGHYADAVESALKALSTAVKAIVRSRGGADLDGAPLMHTAFSPKNPIIVVGDLASQSGKDMQQGYMELFAGVMSAVRNPKAHANVVISRERAIHFLFVTSMLWHTLDSRL